MSPKRDFSLLFGQSQNARREMDNVEALLAIKEK
jgi:hypothetical protein